MDEELETGAEGAEGAADAAAVEARAKAMGWAPKEKWRGDPEIWVDAAEFVERGERVMPILRANSRKLEDKAAELERQNRELANQLTELRGSMDEFVGVQRDMMKERLAQQRTEIRRQLREARDSGDDTAIDALENSLETNTKQQDKLEKQAEKPPAEETPPPNPHYDAWRESNPWFGGTSKEDRRKTALAMEYAREAAGQKLSEKAFFDYVDEQLAETAPPPVRKTESGRPSGGGAAAPGTGGFDKLPPDAKAQAKKDAARFVGPNKLFKTEAAWFAHFAEQYGV